MRNLQKPLLQIHDDEVLCLEGLDPLLFTLAQFRLELDHFGAILDLALAGREAVGRLQLRLQLANLAVQLLEIVLFGFLDRRLHRLLDLRKIHWRQSRCLLHLSKDWCRRGIIRPLFADLHLLEFPKPLRTPDVGRPIGERWQILDDFRHVDALFHNPAFHHLPFLRSRHVEHEERPGLIQDILIDGLRPLGN